MRTAVYAAPPSLLRLRQGELYLVANDGQIYDLPCGYLCRPLEESCMAQAPTVPTYEEVGCYADGRSHVLGLAMASCYVMNIDVSAMSRTSSR